MNILLIGSGGREHALAWKIVQSPLVETLFCTPGNGGIETIASCIDLDIENHDVVIDFCRQQKVGLVVVGPEAPLVDGIADALTAADIPVFGPTAAAAQLEGSKGFTKDMCARYNIPTAAYGRFSDPDSAKKYIAEHGAPIVVKADGLAAGKGVIIAATVAEANTAVDMMFDGGFGAAGIEVVVEEFMVGEEASFFALADGKTTLPLATAQDHKAVGEGDTGPNTGGMGAYSPAPVMTNQMIDRVMAEIIEPTAAAMADMGYTYKGVLFAGLMITETGPKLIEYNCRFGDPECQVLMMRLTSDIVPLLLATADGSLSTQTANWTDDTALTVVLAAKGYPGTYSKGSLIENISAAASDDNIEIFHAGTKRDNGNIVAVGGRVLNVTAKAPSVAEAKNLAYAAVSKINWPDGFCRNDIGWRAINRD